MIHDLLPGRLGLNVVALMHVFEQLGGGTLGDAILEVGADVCSAVRAILLAQVVEYERRGLVGRELHLLFVFLSRRHIDSFSVLYEGDVECTGRSRCL